MVKASLYSEAVLLFAAQCGVARGLHNSANGSRHWASNANLSALWPADDNPGGTASRLVKLVEQAKAEIDPTKLGPGPLGNSPWDCHAAIPIGHLPVCTPPQVERFRSATNTTEIASESGVRKMMDVGVFVAKKNRMSPCRTAPVRQRHRNTFTAVFDLQYSNRPACCSVNEVPSGDGARLFLDSEARARGASVHRPTHGVEFRTYKSIVYSLIEPVRNLCGPHRLCPLVVEVPGAASVPWLLLMSWCRECRDGHGTVLISMDEVGDPSNVYVETIFIPAIKDFLSSRRDVDRDRVFLTSASRGNEIALRAALLHPELFSFSLFVGKFRVHAEILQAAHKAGLKRRGNILQKMSFHVGSDDDVHDKDQDFWLILEQVARAVQLDLDLEVRYYPGGPHAMWFAAWNAYRDLLWTGQKKLAQYRNMIATTCTR